ncbi:hypothetical protein RIF29_25465 [Crotalaria pallida]|uniref:Uncharacterized protein n=1 Tax=Crotalaria pallida TaxID=3830 RepID=A0AAN9ENT8_CROPI
MIQKINVGSGDISLMFDKWLDIGPIYNFVPFVYIHDTTLLVKDVRLNNDWNLNSLYTMLPNLAISAIQSTFFDDQCVGLDEGLDEVVWAESLSDAYSVSSAYHWLSHSRFDVLQSEEKFSWVWIRKSCYADRDRGVLFISALWNLWVARNKLVFDDVTLNWRDL